MDLNFTEDELQFEQEVRLFLSENLPPHIVEATANNSSCDKPKRSALSITITLAFGTFTPTSITVVATII